MRERESNALKKISIKLNKTVIKSDQNASHYLKQHKRMDSLKCKIGWDLDTVFFFSKDFGKNSLTNMKQNKMRFVRTVTRRHKERRERSHQLKKVQILILA